MSSAIENDRSNLCDRAEEARRISSFLRGEMPQPESRKAEIPTVRSLPDGTMRSCEVKEALGVSAGTVSKLISSGKLQAVTYRGRKYVTPEALDAYEKTGRKAGRPKGYSPMDAAYERYRDAVSALDGRREHGGRDEQR